MSYTVIVGLQWGDEGKGKIVDYLAEQHDVIVRFQGGANAGHTVYVEGKEYIFHLLPSGLLRPEKKGALGAGVAVDPEVILDEIGEIEKHTEPLKGRFWIDGRAQIVMPYHKAQDRWEEELVGGIGTTKRGIGPAYRDRYARIGIRIADIFSRDLLKKRLSKSLEYNNQILGARYGKPPFDFHEMLDYLRAFGDAIRPYVRDVSQFLHEEDRKGSKVLLEGAQGTFLDVNFGTYPFVTSSHTTSAGAAIGVGIPPSRIERVIGVTKAYTTRVGKGPFPTELLGKEGEHLRLKGDEFGATTGRPRRCGWLDLVALRFAINLNGVTDLAVTKLDVLAGLEKVKIGTSYRIGNRECFYPPLDPEAWEEITVNYVEFDGWNEFGKARSIQELPGETRDFLEFIEKFLNTKIKYVSIGKERNDIIVLE